MEREPKPWSKTLIPWEEVAGSIPTDHSPAGLEAYQFGFESPRIRSRPEFAAYALESFTPGRPMPEALLDLTGRIHKDFRFDSKVDQCPNHAGRSLQKTSRGVPGFRAPADCLSSVAAPLLLVT